MRAEVDDGKVKNVTFENVPGLRRPPRRQIEVPELGTVTVDVAYGGMFYVIADADQFGLRLTEDEAGDAMRIGEMVKAACAGAARLPVHPDNPDIRGITIGQLSAPPLGIRTPTAATRWWSRPASSTGIKPSTWKGVLDRSPCGTGTCAKMAAMHARGELPLDQDFRHEGILGTIFTGRLVRETTVGEYKAAVPTLSGTAWITGFAQYVVDPQDPFPNGYTVGDIWSSQDN